MFLRMFTYFCARHEIPYYGLLMKNIFYILSVVVLIFVFSRCNEMGGICLSNQNAAQVGLYSSYHHGDVDTVLTNLYIAGIGREDSLVYDSATVSDLFLPLSMHRDTTGFIIKVKTLIDTLWFAYSRNLTYVSGDCGMAVEIDVDTVWFTDRFLDSVVIIQPLIRYNENVENIKLYIY